MTCAYCYKNFNMDQGQKSCQSCAIFGGCQKVKCPYCSYEMPDISTASGKKNGFGHRLLRVFQGGSK